MSIEKFPNRFAVMCLVLPLAVMGCDGTSSDSDAGDDTSGDTEFDTGSDVTLDTEDDPASDTGGDVTTCTEDGDCDDGVYCNGQEVCHLAGYCVPDAEFTCDDDDPCTDDSCDEDGAECVNEPIDEDDDGYAAETGPGGEACGGTDCNDDADDIHPDAAEDECDLVDKDCDDSIDEHIDDDGDGWIDEACNAMSDTTGYEGTGDCADDDPVLEAPPDTIYPGAPEGCDGTIDHDCDGDATDIDSDADGDGHAPLSCAGGDDCDDSDDSVYAGAMEICDLVDNDCDGSILDAAGIDDDSDGVPDEACDGNDCDDTDGTIHGGYDAPVGSIDADIVPVVENCDDVDEDCDGTWADGGADDDGDDYLDEACGGDDCNDMDLLTHPGAGETGCDDIDNDCDGDAIDGLADQDDDDVMNGACSLGTDCDDLDPAVYPGAMQVCDDVDNDCDGVWRDEMGADDDGDTVLDETCGGTDCDDEDADIHPGATLVCDLVDNDCDGVWQDEMGADDDDDDYLDETCGGDDCNDADDSIYPGATEICDTIDQDCDGSYLDGGLGADDDGDTVLDETCGGTDCNDADATIHPGATEICNDGIDQDCDGRADGAMKLASEINLSNTTALSRNATIVWAASTYAVSWGEGLDMVFQRLDPDGTDVGSEQVVPATSLAWSGSEFGQVRVEDYSGNDEVEFSRIDESGVVVGSSVRITEHPADVYAPVIAWGGSGYGIVWGDDRGGDWDVYFASVDPTGTLIDSDVVLGSGSGHSYNADIVWSGSEFGVVFETNNGGDWDITFRTVALDGTPGGSAYASNSGSDDSQDPSIAWTGSRYAVSWQDNSLGNLNVMFVLLDETGAAVSTRRVVNSATTLAAGPDVDCSSQYCGVIWYDTRPTAYNIWFNILDTDGILIGPELQISTLTGTNAGPMIAWSGSEFGIVSHNVSDTEVYYTSIGLCD